MTTVRILEVVGLLALPLLAWMLLCGGLMFAALRKNPETAIEARAIALKLLALMCVAWGVCVGLFVVGQLLGESVVWASQLS